MVEADIAPGTLLQVSGKTATYARVSVDGAIPEGYVARLEPGDTVVMLREHLFVPFENTVTEVDGMLWVQVLTHNGVGWCRASRLKPSEN